MISVFIAMLWVYIVERNMINYLEFCSVIAVQFVTLFLLVSVYIVSLV